MQEKYKLNLPPYPGTSQCVKLSGSQAAGNNGKVDPASIRLNYSLADVSGGLLESDVDPDPLKQFDSWFKVWCPQKALQAFQLDSTALQQIHTMKQRKGSETQWDRWDDDGVKLCAVGEDFRRILLKNLI